MSATVESPSWNWKIWLSLGVCAYLAAGIATHTLQPYHWLLLLLIPGSLLAAERGRAFFDDWAALFFSWVIYDRMRWIQPTLLDRVWVGLPRDLELSLFGWMAGGAIPAHAAKEALDAWASQPTGAVFSIALQVVYLSHVFAYPALFLYWWFRGRSRTRDRGRFRLHAKAFATLNLVGFAGYMLAPVAPPWWVTLNGSSQPTAALVAITDLSLAIHGSLAQQTIATSPNWFAAFPSLHGAYPILLLVLNVRTRNRLWLAVAAAYGSLMWVATVVLNLHYIVDLIAGALLALVIGLCFLPSAKSLDNVC